MNDVRRHRSTKVFGIGACVLFIITFPFYYSFIRNFMLRLKGISNTSSKGLSPMEKVDLALEQQLNKRLRGIGVCLYRLTRGRIVQPYKVDVLLLSTRGRRSGKTRTVLLQFFRDGANMLLVAANSGRLSHPDWYYNLQTTPTAHVQIMGHIIRVRAEELSDEEAITFWPRILHVAPSYARYQKATSRPIPLLRLVPTEAVIVQTITRDAALAG